MTSSSTKYSLSNIKQLIDLNQELVNFQLSFEIKSDNGEPFDVLVVTQEMLDSNPDLPYQKADGFISGNIISDNNVYQNYFLLIKSDSPCDCTVSIQINEVKPNLNNVNNVINDANSQNFPHAHNKKSKKSKKSLLSSFLTTTNIIIFIVCLAIILFWIYPSYCSSSSTKINDNSDSGFNINDLKEQLSDGLLSEGLSNKLSNDISSKITDGISNKLTNDISSKITDGISSKLSGLSEIKQQMSLIQDGIKSNDGKSNSNILSKLNEITL
jgi:hypothetical protein